MFCQMHLLLLFCFVSKCRYCRSPTSVSRIGLLMFSLTLYLKKKKIISRINSWYVPAGSPSRGGDVTVYVWHKPTELAHSFLICSYVYFRLYGFFNCISFHEFSQQISVFWLCSSCLLSSFQLYISVWKSPSALIWYLVVGWAQNTN